MADKEIDSSLVTVGQPVDGGCCWVSFNGAGTPPTDATTKMSEKEGFESAGELSENGFTESKSVSTTTHKGWHGTTLLITNDDETNTCKAEFVEVNRGTAAKLRYGSANVTVADDTGAVTSIKDGGINDDEVALVFDELESNGWLRRTVVKRAKVNSFDDVSHQRGTLMVYGMTFTALAPIDGSAAIEIYRAKPASTDTETQQEYE
jgi:hypothetical protein